LIAFQSGREVHWKSLENRRVSKIRWSAYLDLLSQIRGCTKIGWIQRNSQGNVKTAVGISMTMGFRNAIIQISIAWILRADVGELWKNYLAIERKEVSQLPTDSMQSLLLAKL